MLVEMKLKGGKPIHFERAFFIAVMVFGMLYSVILTPNTVYDEVRHYVSAYRYSNVLLFQEFSLDNGNFLMRTEDKKILDYSEFLGSDMLKKVKDNFWTKPEGEKYVECKDGYYGNFIQYIPQSLGITFGRLLGLGHLQVFYLGRIFNLLAYTMLMLICIRKIPFGKMVMVLIGLLPICVHQAASLNYDAVLNGSAFCFIAYIFFLAYSENEIKKRDIIMTAMFAAILGAYKGGVYVFLCGLLFMIPKNRLGTKKRWILVVGGIMSAFFIMIILLNLWRIQSVVVEGGTSVDGKYSFYRTSYLLEKPSRYFVLLWNSIQRDGLHYIFSAFGGWLGGRDVILIPRSYILTYIALVITAVFYRNEAEGENKTIENSHKVWFLLIFFSLMFVLFFVFIVAWTPQGSNIILGLQGRYFVPVLPLLFFLFRIKGVYYKRNIETILFGAACILQLLVLAIIYIPVIFFGVV